MFYDQDTIKKYLRDKRFLRLPLLFIRILISIAKFEYKWYNCIVPGSSDKKEKRSKGMHIAASFCIASCTLTIKYFIFVYKVKNERRSNFSYKKRKTRRFIS